MAEKDSQDSFNANGGKQKIDKGKCITLFAVALALEGERVDERKAGGG